MPTELYPREVMRNGRICSLVTAGKAHECFQCHTDIYLKSQYYSVVCAGSGVQGKTNARRVHPECLDSYLARYEGQ
jgi:hypothetical protein